MNACGSNPCRNSGQCVPEDAQTYRCACIRGHSGKNCQIFPRQGQSNTRNLTFYLGFIDKIFNIVNEIFCNCMKLVKGIEYLLLCTFNQVKGGVNGENGQSVQFSVGEV